MDWWNEIPGSVTVIDAHGIIVAMNEESARQFAGDGGRRLIGSNILDCHPEPSRTKLAGLMAERRENIYTVEKLGRWRLIRQFPWFDQGEYAGFVEMSFEVPPDIPHLVRA